MAREDRFKTKFQSQMQDQSPSPPSARRGSDHAAHRAAPLRTARGLLTLKAEGKAMEAIVVVGAVVGSFAGAFVLQKAALEGLFRMMNADRRARH
jgi:hypothetical protein